MVRSIARLALLVLAASLPLACAPSSNSAPCGAAQAQTKLRADLSAAPSLGTARTFAVLAGTTMTNIGQTQLTGDLGVSPGSAITGFPPGSVLPPGTTHAADSVALQAQNDVTTAYSALAAAPCAFDKTGIDLGGLTLIPGVYCFTSEAQLTGTLTLDAQSDANAVFVFQIGKTLTTASGASIRLINSGNPCNVFFQVGSSATIATTTQFNGNIVALTSIAVQTGASVGGRALARNGAVTLDTNTVMGGQCAVAPSDAGTPQSDAGTSDAGTSDAGASDAGTLQSDAGSCGE